MWIGTGAGSKFSFCSRMSWCRSWTFQLRFKEIETSCQSRQTEEVLSKNIQMFGKSKAVQRDWHQRCEIRPGLSAWVEEIKLQYCYKCSLCAIFPQICSFFFCVNQTNCSDELHTTRIVFGHSDVKINRKNGSRLCLHYFRECCKWYGPVGMLCSRVVRSDLPSH